RFDQNREVELLRSTDALAARNDHKIRNVDPVVMQNFFRDALVFAERQSGRAAASEGQTLHFEERNDVLIEARVVLELLDQIEKDIWLEAFDFLPDKIDVVENSKVIRGVTELGERGHHVCFGLPFLSLHL